MPCLADRSMVKHVIRSQQRKLREEMKVIVKQKATQSAYPSLNRQDKRIAEFHHDRLTQEQSLQKDTKKAERLARRIAQILDQLRKDFNKIKNFLGDYNFTSTIGKDSDCAGQCDNDLSTGVDTRQAWKRELENLLTMVYHYVDAQHLGDYALLHQTESPYDESTCNSSQTTVKSCCSKVYRPYFYYYTPDGDCLAMAPEAGGNSGNSNALSSTTTSYGNETVTGNYNGSNSTRGCVLGYKTGSINNAAEGAKTAPASLKHFQVCNKDLEIRQMWRLLVGSNDGQTKDAKTWHNFLFANSYVYKNSAVGKPLWDAALSPEAKAVHLAGYFRNTICLPEDMVLALEDVTVSNSDGGQFDSVLAVIANDVDNGNAVLPATHNFAANGSWAGSVANGTYSNGAGDIKQSAMNSIPNICNVEDEPDLQFIIKVITCVMENVRSCQINNDREQQVIDYVRDASECNEAYHQDVFSDMTAIDESELCQRYTVGKELCNDLDTLYKENCCTKQNFFNDITLDGCCW